ncbi:MAG: F0F1 ATP synthase subunit epsilon [Chloroflexi bacterium]|nr:F0F1 ATP synthase subunit epsilon [Chloroflexota bacterium]
MCPLRLEIVTAERQIFAEDVDMVVAPGIEGELGILPHHAPLLTTLKPGELRIKKSGEEILLAVTGGFMEVLPDRVTILADAAERAEEIDLARAEAARQRAQERVAGHATELDRTRAMAAMARATARLRVAQKLASRRRAPGQGRLGE